MALVSSIFLFLLYNANIFLCNSFIKVPVSSACKYNMLLTTRSGVARIWREGGGHGTDTWILDNELVLVLAFLQHKQKHARIYIHSSY